MPFLAGVILYACFLIISKSPSSPPFLKGETTLFPSLAKRGQGDFERDSQSVGAAHPTNDNTLALYRNLSKLFSTALLLVWAYKILKEVYLWH